MSLKEQLSQAAKNNKSVVVATPNHINGFRRYEVSRDDCVSEITWFKKTESQWEILRKGW